MALTGVAVSFGLAGLVFAIGSGLSGSVWPGSFSPPSTVALSMAFLGAAYWWIQNPSAARTIARATWRGGMAGAFASATLAGVIL